ncbi:MAG: hypothetical protein A7316_09870 [Candidatus Altiarchaeales archaeon WOR_SM1_86-2]|nr:MAG: hypothetical protein A7316_09870 [Candidatus Altiarchaeales archaeon WOR_SM1_86-2]ODS39694.1 MAG: hypothetical protein A7315_10685 [Candidatus Altiarchaeales archaeon WOR_SM1_79]
MKLCIPTKGSGGMKAEVNLHFWRAPTFTIADTEKNDVKVMDDTSRHIGGKGYPPETMQRDGVEIMLWSGLG